MALMISKFCASASSTPRGNTPGAPQTVWLLAGHYSLCDAWSNKKSNLQSYPNMVQMKWMTCNKEKHVSPKDVSHSVFFSPARSQAGPRYWCFLSGQADTCKSRSHPAAHSQVPAAVAWRWDYMDSDGLCCCFWKYGIYIYMYNEIW